MTVTIYSFITSVLFFSISILICDILRRKNTFILHYNVNSLLCLITISVFRLCIPLEIPATNVVNSYTVLPAFQQLFKTEVPIFNKSLSISSLLLFICFIGSVVCFISLNIRILKDVKIVKSLELRNIDNDKVTLYMKQITANSRRKYKIILSNKVSTPMVTGLFTPAILLPTMVTKMTDEELHNILVHEWHHVLNNDLFVKLVVEILICLMWWNPVMYILKNNLEQSLEIRCDISVTKSMSKKERLNYLRVLLLVAHNFIKVDKDNSPHLLRSNFGYSSTIDDLFIRQRFDIISKYDSAKPHKSIILISIMFVLLILSYFVVFQPASHPPSEDITGAYTFDILNTENTYILVESNGINWLISQETSYDISDESLLHKPYNLLPIIYE